MALKTGIDRPGSLEWRHWIREKLVSRYAGSVGGKISAERVMYILSSETTQFLANVSINQPAECAWHSSRFLSDGEMIP